MPEHVEAIQRLWKEEERVEKAMLDEQQFEETEFALPIVIKYYNGFNYSCTKVEVLNLDNSKCWCFQ